jgi:hypothetical protein
MQTLTAVILVMPNTKQIASKIFDFPEPFKPVMALKDGSHPIELSKDQPSKEPISTGKTYL